MKNIELRPDCAKCASLCCVALAFDKSDLFAVDKKAGELCAKLDSGNGCSIYSQRDKQGYSGCIGFNCYGAGQRVTQQLFKEKTWKDDHKLIESMARLFIAVLRAHECLNLLYELHRLNLPYKESRRSVELIRALESEIESEQDFFCLASATREFLRTLEAHISQKIP